MPYKMNKLKSSIAKLATWAKLWLAWLALYGTLNGWKAEAQWYEKIPQFKKAPSWLYLGSWYHSSRIENIDVKTAEVLYWEYGIAFIKDKDKVCRYEISRKYNPNNVDTLEWVDTTTFKVLYDDLACDKNKIYDFTPDKRFQSWDVKTIGKIDASNGYMLFVVDKNNVFYRWRTKLEWAVPASFKVINGAYCKDENNVRYVSCFWWWADVKKLEWIKPKDAKALPGEGNERKITDGKNIFDWWKKLEGVVAEGFKEVGDAYKDIDNVWIQSKKIEWADAESFKEVNGDPLYKYEDKNNYYDEQGKPYKK